MWQPQVLSSHTGIPSIIRCLACKKAAANARAAVVWGGEQKLSKNGKLPMTLTQKASLPEHSRGCHSRGYGCMTSTACSRRYLAHVFLCALVNSLLQNLHHSSFLY
ncbi:unnamed protein product, partial [Ectocarpus sp. 12 AP-2014]